MNPWAHISDIAAKLGVEPEANEDRGFVTLLAEGADGKMYDVWKVVDALLVRVDEVLKK